MSHFSKFSLILPLSAYFQNAFGNHLLKEFIMHLVKQDKNDSLEHLKIICVWRYVAMNFMLM